MRHISTCIMSDIILGIESSCDDTSAAIIKDGILLSNVIASQSVHEAYGGVVPELASRAHQQNIVPVVSEAIKRAGIQKNDISAIAFTAGPGLIGSLLVGTSFAKGLSTALGIPMVCVNHLHGHVLSHFIKEDESTVVPEFPYMCLLVSGGNSQIIIVEDFDKMQIIGQTIDDAAGEAFDKCAKVMGLPYPGGPYIDKLAQEGNANRFKFSKPHIAGLDYSFRFHRKKQSRPCGFFATNNHRHPIRQTGKSRKRASGNTANCHRRRSFGQFRHKESHRGLLPSPTLDGIHPQKSFHHRQCRHGCHRRIFQIPRQRILSARHRAVCTGRDLKSFIR